MDELTPAPLPEYQPAHFSEASQASAPNFRLQKFLQFLLRYWWVPTATLLLSMGAAVLYARHQPATYVSTASMWQTAKLRLPETALFADDMENFIGTQNDLLQSTLLRDRTLAALRTASNGVAVPLDVNGEPLPVRIHVSQAAKSAVFVLEATSSQAAYTQAYLETLMQAYMDYNDEIHKQISGVTLDSITEQVQGAEQELKTRQDALTDFERTNNLAILQEEGTVAGAYLTKLKTELSDLELDDQLQQAVATNIMRNASIPTESNFASVGTNNLLSWPGSGAGGMTGEIQNTVKELEQLENQRTLLSTNLRDSHPRMVQLNADIEGDEKTLDVYRLQSREQADAARETTKLRLENVHKSIAEWEARVIEANYWIAEVERLKIRVQRAQGQYDELVGLMQNVKISGKIDQETLAILEHASPARRSYSAQIGFIKTALGGGFILGFGFIAWLAFRDEKFSSVLEINEKLGDAVIAQVPELPGLNGHLPLLENNGAMHTYAESYRCLRSALLFLGEEAERPRLLLITSALPDEGKSTVAANLARTLAQGGARVLLVDADLRRGGLHNLLGLQQEPGLAHLLNHPADADRVIQTNSLPNLWFLASGAHLNNPGDKFLGAALDELLRRWRSQFDYVLIDSSPIFAADDATTLAPKVDGTLLVVRSRFSNARQVRNAIEMLYQRRARVLGVVFNRANASSRSYDYYKYAKYYPVAARATVKTG